MSNSSLVYDSLVSPLFFVPSCGKRLEFRSKLTGKLLEDVYGSDNIVTRTPYRRVFVYLFNVVYE